MSVHKDRVEEHGDTAEDALSTVIGKDKYGNIIHVGENTPEPTEIDPAETVVCTGTKYKGPPLPPDQKYV